MKKLVLYFISLIILVSCATVPLEILESDDHLRMIGGKEALLNAIVYPENALRNGIEGIVTVLAYVDTSGSVRECKIIEGDSFLNDAALAAMKKQRFHPYILEGKKRPVRVAIPISFTISKDINVMEYESKRIRHFAEEYLNEPVITLTEFQLERSEGSKNDYYSEALTWWPNPEKPNAPYMIKEGTENPDAFRAHAELFSKVGKVISGLTVAYLETGRVEYAKRAADHIRAWFIDPATRMEPHLNFAQAIPNRTTGRVVGILEGLPLVEIIQSFQYIEKFLTELERKTIDDWLIDYKDFLEWGNYSDDLIRREDNYSMAWLVQMSAIAKHLDDEEYLALAYNYFIQHTIPFTLKENTKYIDPNWNRKIEYNIFFLTDMLAIEAELLSDLNSDPWNEQYYTGARIGDLINFVYSGILNYDLKKTAYYDGRFMSLLLAGKAYENYRYLEMWRDLNSDEFMKTHFPIREAVLWTK